MRHPNQGSQALSDLVSLVRVEYLMLRIKRAMLKPGLYRGWGSCRAETREQLVMAGLHT